jgi:hypothetical protein
VKLKQQYIIGIVALLMLAAVLVTAVVFAGGGVAGVYNEACRV